jgi:hypothetical protein
MSLLDEAMAGVISGEGDPLTVAQMSCMTMVVCGQLPRSRARDAVGAVA